MKTNQNIFFGIIAVVTITFITTGCPQPEPPPVTGTVSSLDDLAASLAGLPNTGAATPSTVPLASSIAIDTEDTNANGVWATINSTVRSAEKYVILDLTNCTAAGNTISGHSSPTGNNMNIIQYNQYIKGILLPDTLTSIGAWAFSGCRSLTSVTIPSSVTTIGEGAFTVCIGLTSVTIPGSVTIIGESAFGNCTGLTSVTFDEGSSISSSNFGSNSFPGNLRDKYLTGDGDAGTYTRPSGGSTWTKQ